MMNHQEDVMSRAQEPPVMPAPPTPRRDYFDDPRRKSPILALILSAMPGLGQVYVGFYQQGFTNALVVASIIGLLNSRLGLVHRIEPLFGLFLAFFWLYNMVDAWRRAVFYNNALAGIGPAAMPEEFTVGMRKGSAIGGAAMILVGVLLLSNTLLGMPLDWLERWWPVVFIAIGAWLAYPAIAGGKKPNEPEA
jgi:hypothetical protein